MVGHFVAPLVFGALAEVLPDRVQADSGMTNIMNVIGRNPKGEEFTTLYFSAGGFGAMEDLDGLATTPSPSNMMVMPTETWEVLTGIRVLSRRLRPDSGGSGKSRGGLGQEITMRNDTGNLLTIYAMGARTVFPALGVRDGKPGALRIYRLNGQEIQAQGRYDLKPGDKLELLEAGGGGYGDPKKRDRRKIAADLAQGFLTAETAERDYGRV
jgi:N-methylhydantoinase B